MIFVLLKIKLCATMYYVDKRYHVFYKTIWKSFSFLFKVEKMGKEWNEAPIIPVCETKKKLEIWKCLNYYSS